MATEWVTTLGKLSPNIQLIEAPYFISSDSLALNLDRVYTHDPRRAVALVIADICRRSPIVRDRTAQLIQSNHTRRDNLRFMGGFVLGVAASLKPTATQAQDVEIYSNEFPGPDTPHYFPVDQLVAQREGLITLDEVGGPLHVGDILNYYLRGIRTHTRDEWAERITQGLMDEIRRKSGEDDALYQKLLNVAGYCSFLPGAQIRMHPANPGDWYPDLSQSPELAEEEPLFKVSEIAILGQQVAVMASGTLYKPIDYTSEEKSADGPTDKVWQNIIYCRDVLPQTPLGRYVSAEYPINWYHAGYIEGDTFVGLNFGKGLTRIPLNKLVSISIPLSRKQTKLLNDSGFKISEEQVNRLNYYIVQDLKEDWVDENSRMQQNYT